MQHNITKHKQNHNNDPKWIIKQVANQVKAQNIQKNADRDLSVTDELHFKSVCLYWQKRSAFNKISEKGHASHVTWKRSSQNMLYW